MEGEQLPKATMNSFIKSKTNMPFQPEFLTKMLMVSKGINIYTQSSSIDSQTELMSCAKAIPKKPSQLNTSKQP